MNRYKVILKCVHPKYLEDLAKYSEEGIEVLDYEDDEPIYVGTHWNCGKCGCSHHTKYQAYECDCRGLL